MTTLEKAILDSVDPKIIEGIINRIEPSVLAQALANEILQEMAHGRSGVKHYQAYGNVTTIIKEARQQASKIVAESMAKEIMGV